MGGKARKRHVANAGKNEAKNTEQDEVGKKPEPVVQDPGKRTKSKKRAHRNGDVAARKDDNETKHSSAKWSTGDWMKFIGLTAFFWMLFMAIIVYFCRQQVDQVWQLTQRALGHEPTALEIGTSLLEAKQFYEAELMFNEALTNEPDNPAAMMGKAHCEEMIAERERNNARLEAAIGWYERVLSMTGAAEVLVVQAGLRLSELQNFMGRRGRALNTLRTLIGRVPERIDLLNKLGEQFLLIGQLDNARTVFSTVLAQDQKNAFALMRMGFIEVTSSNYPLAVQHLREASLTDDSTLKDARFYLNYGDALYRVGETAEARKVFEEAADIGLFSSSVQRSLYNVHHLVPQPNWPIEETGHSRDLAHLRQYWTTIRDEAIESLAAGHLVAVDSPTVHHGERLQMVLLDDNPDSGGLQETSCARVPRTCELLHQWPGLVKCDRCQVKLTALRPGTHIWPHCSATNYRLRAHLGLVVPDGQVGGIRVAHLEPVVWRAGELFIFDESLEHELWHNGSAETATRLVLEVAFPHPEIVAGDVLEWSWN